MKRKYLIWLISIFLIFSIPGIVPIIKATIWEPTPLSFQSKTYYQVFFDEEKDAYVLARFEIFNWKEENLTQISFEIPGKWVSLRYIIEERRPYSREIEFLDYEVQQLSNSYVYKVNLSQPLHRGEGTNLYLYYKVKGYVKKFINFNFDFETVKLPFEISYVRVSVGVDSNLYLRGGKTRTDFRSELSFFESLTRKVAKTQASNIGYYFERIKYARDYVKEKRMLDAWESFHVTGSYNYKELFFLTYIKEILIGLVVLLILLILFKTGMLRFDVFKRKEWEGFRKLRRKELTFGRLVALTFFTSLISISSLWGIFSLFSSRWRIHPFIVFLGVVLLGCIFILTFSGPAFYFGRKYEISTGILTFLLSLGWLFLFLLILSLLLPPPFPTLFSHVY